MSEISRSALFGKLNKIAYQSVESATVFCKMRGNPYVEVVHWIQQVLQLADSDLHRIVKSFEIDPSILVRDITSALDSLPRGATSISDFSPHLEESVERGWVYGSLMLNDTRVRTGHMILGMLKTRSLKSVLLGISSEFGKISEETLGDQFDALTGDSPETGSSAQGASEPGTENSAMAPPAMGKGEALAQFTVDMTEEARSGDMDPIVGRDDEVRQLVDILMRRRQNNPILTGEAGVGKTAVVEGFAQRIARGDVPPSLRDVKLLSLDIGLLQAGASMKGEFEERLRQVIEEVQSSETPIILFIDEAHTLIGAGGAAGTGDAANLLKPALARGNLRTVAATTWAEYKKHIEKDPALTRRFQVVQVLEPSEEKAIKMMRGIAKSMQKHHAVEVLDEALEASVRLSHRYIPARQLPDKSVSLLDTACARVAISQHAVPAQIDDCRRQIESLETEMAIIARESAVGVDTAERKQNVDASLVVERDRLTVLEERWAAEGELVARIVDLQNQLREASEPAADDSSAAEDNTAAEGQDQEPEAALSAEERKALLDELAVKRAALTELQGEEALILPVVGDQAVASVVQDWTGIPVGKMVSNEISTVLHLADNLEQRIIGQRHALDMIAKRIQTSRAKLDNPNKPIGVFMLAGTSGVGKTETALALAESLYGGEQNLITINMSEYQEAHTVSSLKGAPPGYVGYGEGGVLTEAVRRRPYSVVLLDEVEKAHPDVHELFFQVFDKGWMEDGEGRAIDFKNTLILLTTNAGTDLISSLCDDPELMPEPDAIAKALREPLLKEFPPALLGRLVVIPYFPLSDDMILAITRLQLARIQKRIEAAYGIPLTVDDAAVELIRQRCIEVESGGRMIDAILTNTVLPEISREFLTRMMEDKPITAVCVSETDGQFSYQFE
ncbi:probable ClpA/B-type chaperone [marine gamma proteobacterium HTCC2080]|jgi:type VI secretion system protein VasG|nr:probable ClpA/B-type chaperone [marine gamma proteobacterium HTCC2080]